MVRSMVPPVFRISGKNFRIGRSRYFSFAPNFRMSTPIAAKVPRTPFRFPD
jgi:hypothetical protein